MGFVFQKISECANTEIVSNNCIKGSYKCRKLSYNNAQHFVSNMNFDDVYPSIEIF